MAGYISSRYGRYRKILVAVLLLLVALSITIILPGCGGDNTVVETEKQEEKEEETIPEDEVEEEEEEEDEETSDSWEEEEEEENGESVELGQEYTNYLFGFSVAYPDDWECVETENGDGCNITYRLDDGGLLANATVFGEYNLDGITPEERVDAYAETVESVHSRPIERDSSTLTVDTFNGAEYAIDYWISELESGVRLYEDVMFVTEGDKIYGFLAAYPVELVDEIDPIVAAMINSFTLIE